MGKILENVPCESCTIHDQPSAQSPALNDDQLLLDLSTQLLRDGKSVRFRAPGRSMYPTIRENETIRVDPVGPHEVKVGDIILYRGKENLIAHRVREVERKEANGPRFILCEDTWATLDDPVEPEQILGKVVSVERAGRSIDLYSRRVKMRLFAHALASWLKHWIIRIFR